MTYKIAIIAPYDRLVDLSREVSIEFEDSIEVHKGSVTSGVSQALELQNQGIEVIISEGITSVAIRKIVRIPVVDILLDDHNILDILYHASLENKAIAIVTNSRLISEKEMIEDLLNISIVEYIFNESTEIHNIVKKIKYTGITTVIGGIQATHLAEKLGMKGVLLENGKESLFRAIKEAKNIAEVRRREQYRSKYLQAVLKFSQEGILVVDENARVTLINPIAEEIFGVSSESALGKRVEAVIPNTRLNNVVETAIPELEKIQKVNVMTTIMVNRVPITLSGKVIGAVATFKDVTKIQELEKRIRHDLYSRGHYTRYSLQNLIGNSEKINETKRKAIQYAETDSTVLITGESGTGKEIFAHSIHNMSRRAKGPFVAINCSTLQENLLESELFGYEEGAFTGASKSGKQGLFLLAHGGSIFLDEIDSIDKDMQVRLLRVLQEKEVRSVGSSKVIPIDVRVIAATNANMKDKVSSEEFRADLFYRLNVLRINIPPLRERRGDIGELILYFFNKAGISNAKIITSEALKILKDYNWPGNVRELENVVERLIALTRDENIIQVEHLLYALEDDAAGDLEVNRLEILAEGTLEDMKSKIVIQTLKKNQGNVMLSARKLGISRVQLWRIKEKVT